MRGRNPKGLLPRILMKKEKGMTSIVPCSLGNWVAAFLPILVLLVLMITFRWRATEAAPIGLFAALLIAMTVFKADLTLIAAEASKGIWSALVVLIVIWPALLMYEISSEAKYNDYFALCLACSSDDIRRAHLYFSGRLNNSGFRMLLEYGSCCRHSENDRGP